MSPAAALRLAARAHRVTADALEALAAAHAEPQADPSELVEHERWPFSRRVACKLARSGAIKAKRSGKRWIATRAALDAYLASCPGAAKPADDGAPSVASILRAVRAV